MNELTLAKATGCSKSEWFEIIRAAGKANASHKEIADFLHEAHDVSAWWAQEITVEYDKYIGRRILGQTQGGFFQFGVSKTITAAADTVWNLLQSGQGISLITSNPDADSPPGSIQNVPASLKALNALDGTGATGIPGTRGSFIGGGLHR